MAKWRSSLQVLHLGQQHAGIGNNRPARFENQLQIAAGQFGLQRGGILLRVGRVFVAVVNAEATADIEVMNMNAIGRQTINQRQQTVHRLEERFDLGQLRADVAIDADDVDVWQRRRLLIQGDSPFNRHTELVLFEPSGDIRVGAGIDVRIDAY